MNRRGSNLLLINLAESSLYIELVFSGFYKTKAVARDRCWGCEGKGAADLF